MDWKENRLSVRGPNSEQDWDRIAAVMKEHRIAKLSAGGMLRHPRQMFGAFAPGSRAGWPDQPDHRSRARGAAASNATAELPRCLDAGHLGYRCRQSQICHQLEKVSLTGAPAGDGAIQALAGKRHLRQFHTGRAAITNAGVAHLAQLPRLREIARRTARRYEMSSKFFPPRANKLLGLIRAPGGLISLIKYRYPYGCALRS